MKRFSRLLALCLALVMLDTGALASTMELPSGLTVIESRAFYGDDSIDKVVLREGVREIRDRAFANSGLTEIDLPESLESISETAFDGPEQVRIHAKAGSYAHEWAVAHGYLTGSGDEVFDTRALTGSTVEITGYHGEGGSVAIPAAIDGKSVTAIADRAFQGNAALAYVDLTAAPLERIGEYAFYRCEGLRYISVKAGLVEIGAHAFDGCGALARFDMPNTLERIGSQAFNGCASLHSVSIPQSVTQLGDFAFRRCESLVSASLFSAIGVLPRGTFQYCRNLEELIVSDTGLLESFTEIGDWAFDSCAMLSVYFESSASNLRRIGRWAFHNCDSLDSMNIPSGVTAIGANAFKGCDLMNNCTIPATVGEIGEGCFSDCPSLVSFSAEGTALGEIPGGMFRNCRSLFDVELPSGITAIGSEAFSHCIALNALTLPSGVRSIGSLAFDDCIGLASIYIPASVTDIADDAFHYGWNGMTINGSAGSAAQSFAASHGLSFVTLGAPQRCTQGDWQYEIQDGVCVLTGYTGSATQLSIPATLGGYTLRAIGERAFRNKTALVKVVVPTGVLEIRRNAFYGCASLKELSLPQSCDHIEVAAFRGCSGLESIAVPDSISCVPDYCFYGCTSLSAIDLPPCVIRIGRNAFRGCASLAHVGLSDGLAVIGESAFEGCGMETIELPESLTTLGHGAFCDCASLREIRVPPRVKQLWESTFSGCAALESVELSVGLNSIGSRAFYGCESLSHISIPEGVRVIADFAFGGCISLASVSVPSSLNAIGERAFDNCGALNAIDLPDALSSIGDWAFRSCGSLSDIVIPDSVLGVGTGAFCDCGSLQTAQLSCHMDAVADSLFENCGQLRSVDIPDGVRAIGSSAFANCGSLLTLRVPVSVKDIAADTFQGSPNVTMRVTQGSSAERYAQDAGMSYAVESRDDPGALAGTLLYASDQHTTVPNARVRLSSPGICEASFKCPSNGSFIVSNLPQGEYKIVVTAPGFMEFTDFVTIRPGETTYTEAFLMIEGRKGDRGTASGKITDAITGADLSGVLISFRKGWDNPDRGNAVGWTETQSDGTYSIELPIGNYTASVWHTGYMNSSFNIVVQKDVDTPNQDYMMSTTVTPDQYRIILTWNAQPRDLDAHVQGKLSGGGDFHVYFRNKTSQEGGTVVCNLDRDDTSGYGREVITLTPTTSSPYYYYVHNFSNDGAIPASGASIEIFRGSKRLRIVNVPRDAAAMEYWNVFAINDGQIAMRNTMTASPDTGYFFEQPTDQLTVSPKSPVVYLGAGQSHFPEYVFSDGHVRTPSVQLTQTSGSAQTANCGLSDILAVKPGKAAYDCTVIIDDPANPPRKLSLHTGFTAYVVCALNSDELVDMGVGETVTITPKVYSFQSGEPAIDLSQASWDFDEPLSRTRFTSSNPNVEITRVSGSPSIRLRGLNAMRSGDTLRLTMHSDQYGYETSMWLRVSGAPTGITFDRPELKLGIGETREVSAIMRNGSWYQPVWTSENPNIATVDQNGVVTAVGTGSGVTATTWIKVTAGSVSNRLKVTVGQKPTGIRFSPTSLEMANGFLHAMPEASFTNAGAIGQKVYSSSNPGVVAVTKRNNQEILEARSTGTATITVALAYDRSIRATCTVTVKDLDLWKRFMDILSNRDKVLKKATGYVKSFSKMLEKDCDEKIGERKAELISRIKRSISMTDSISTGGKMGLPLPKDARDALCGHMLDVIFDEMQRDRSKFSNIKEGERFIREVGALCMKDGNKYTFPLGSQLYTYKDTGAGDALTGGRISMGELSTMVDGILTTWPVIIVYRDATQMQAYMDELRELADLKLDEAWKAVISDSASLLEIDTLCDYLESLVKAKHSAAFKKFLGYFPDLEAAYNSLVDIKTQLSPVKDALDNVKALTSVDKDALKNKSFSEMTSWISDYSSKITGLEGKVDAALTAVENFRF